MLTKSCEVTAFRNVFTVKIDRDIAVDQQFEFVITKAIDNPLLERPSDLF